MFQEKDFFYCYSSNLFAFLKIEKKINYICAGLHCKTMKNFWQFKKDDELAAALSEYKRRGIEKGIR